MEQHHVKIGASSVSEGGDMISDFRTGPKVVTSGLWASEEGKGPGNEW